MNAPPGYWYRYTSIDIPPMGQCWQIDLYENGKGEKWAERWPISDDEAWSHKHPQFVGRIR